MKLSFVFFLAILSLAACQSTEPVITCEQRTLQSCVAAPWYAPWEAPACEAVLDAESDGEIACE